MRNLSSRVAACFRGVLGIGIDDSIVWCWGLNSKNGLKQRINLLGVTLVAREASTVALKRRILNHSAMYEVDQS